MFSFYSSQFINGIKHRTNSGEIWSLQDNEGEVKEREFACGVLAISIVRFGNCVKALSAQKLL